MGDNDDGSGSDKPKVTRPKEGKKLEGKKQQSSTLADGLTAPTLHEEPAPGQTGAYLASMAAIRRTLKAKTFQGHSQAEPLSMFMLGDPSKDVIELFDEA